MILYNEIEPYAAQWLKNLSLAGHIAPGRVDARSISDLDLDDVSRATQFHAFAGLGAWSLALRMAGWSDDRVVWTGSCPCQPFSNAGLKKGVDDERHLWPEWRRLIGLRLPPVLFGEQVSSRDGKLWLAAVRADLEAMGYVVGAADLCAAGAGAPHARQRLYFGAFRPGEVDLGHPRREGLPPSEPAVLRRAERDEQGGAAEQSGGPSGADLGLANAPVDGRGGEYAHLPRGTEDGALPSTGGGGEACGGWADQRRPEPPRDRLADPDRQQRDGSGDLRTGGRDESADRGGLDQRGPLADTLCSRWAERGAGPGVRPTAWSGQLDAWSDVEYLPCRDGKYRPAKPGIFPLAHGTPGRVGKLRTYGNAIVPQVAARFIRAMTEAMEDYERATFDKARLT